MSEREPQDWVPLPYMQRAVDFLCANSAAGLPLEPGARKTSITLAAFARLKAEDRANKMLVVAPLRVCHMTWPGEIAKWRQFAHLRVSKMLGTREQREQGLAADADVYLINPESVIWLSVVLGEKPWPFDVVCIDELTKFKNPQAQRSKRLRPLLRHAKRRWALTGSLTANGYLDVFGQQLMLDDGASLGRYVTRYRTRYFTADYTGFVWTLRPGADKEIAAKISPYWFDVHPSEYAQLPEVVDDVRDVALTAAQRAQYAKLESSYVLSLSDTESVTASNAAACYTKLSQIANGAVYADSGEVTVVHDAKLDALEELLEELNGAPLLIGYEFRHDLERLRARFGKLFPDGELPCLGGGKSARQEQMWQEAWNRGELRLLAAHPQSAGHGLNLQGSNAQHVAWFSVPWSWELYDQFIRRVRRSGNTSERVFNHILRVPDTIDDLKLTAVRKKCKTHAEFMGLLLSYIKKGETVMTTDALPPGWTRPLTRNGNAQSVPVAPAAATDVVSLPPAQAQRQKIREVVAAFVPQPAPQPAPQPVEDLPNPFAVAPERSIKTEPVQDAEFTPVSPARAEQEASVAVTLRSILKTQAHLIELIAQLQGSLRS